MKIIALEGLDKSGKHTVSEALATKLRESGYKVEKSEFGRYDTPTGKLIMDFLKGDDRIDSFTHQTLLYCNKQEQQGWFKKLEEDGVDFLILDRYTLSQFVYGNYFIQEEFFLGKIDRGTFDKQIEAHCAMSNGALRLPDINIVLDVSAETSMKRKGQHGENDRYESNKLMLETVRNHYLNLAYTREDTISVDAEKPLEEVINNTFSAFAFMLECKISDPKVQFENVKDYILAPLDVEQYEPLVPIMNYPVHSVFNYYYKAEDDLL